MTDKTDNTEMAQDRTDWAEDRTILANERTFAGWMRTGMACVALALGLRAVFGDFEPTWLPRLVALGFIATAIFIFWAARNRSCEATRVMDQHSAKPQGSRNMTIIASVLTAGAIATGAVLWFL